MKIYNNSECIKRLDSTSGKLVKCDKYTILRRLQHFHSQIVNIYLLNCLSLYYQFDRIQENNKKVLKSLENVFNSNRRIKNFHRSLVYCSHKCKKCLFDTYVSHLGWITRGNMNNAREIHTASISTNGKVLVIAGRNGSVSRVVRSSELLRKVPNYHPFFPNAFRASEFFRIFLNRGFFQISPVLWSLV